MPSGIHRRVTHGKSAPAITPATPAGSRARPRPRDRRRAHRALMTARHLARRRRRQAQPCIASASQQPHGRGSWPGDSRHVPRDRQDQTTGRTVPIAASLTLAALLRPLIPAARAGRRPAGAPGQWLPPCPRGHQDLPPAPPGLRPPSCPARTCPSQVSYRHRGSRGVRAAGAGRPEVPARPGPAGCPRAGRAAPGRARSGPSGTTAADAQAAINSLPQRPVGPFSCRYSPTRVRSHADTSSSPATTKRGRAGHLH
jgi:hypothetical protein